MGLFGDFHQLSDGLKLIEKLTETTQNLVHECEKLNSNIERLIFTLEQQNKKQAKNKNRSDES